MWPTTDHPPYGVTLVELMVTLGLFAALMTAVVLSFRPILLAWSNHQDRMSLQTQVQAGMEKVIRDLRLAKAMQSDTMVTDAIRFTVRESGVDNSYVFYLYSANDPLWDNTYPQPSYQLRKAGPTVGIGGTFTYGSGTLLIQNIQPPPVSDLSVSGSVATLDLTLVRFDETYRLFEKVKRRNL